MGVQTVIKKVTLRNGVRMMSEMNKTVRSVSIGIWVKTGSRNEARTQNGISHFIEHMLFKGTKHRTAQQIAEAFDRIGGQVNAFTAKEYTCYHAKVLDEHARIALDVLQDMFFHSTFEEREIEKEKQVVFEEIKMVEDTPDDQVHDLLSEASFGRSTLAYPILGQKEVLADLCAEDLHDYMARFYTGDRVVVSVAGRFDEALLAEMEEIFSQVPRGQGSFHVPEALFTPTMKYRQKETEQAHLCLAYPGLPIGADHTFALVLLNNALGGSMSSRLFQAIREEQGLCYSVFSYHAAYEETGLLNIYAATQHQQLQQLAEEMNQVIKHIQRDGITKNELDNGKEQLKGSIMLGLESMNSRMNRNGKNELLRQRSRSLDELIADIQTVTLEEVNALAEAIFIEKPAVSLISASEDVPETLYT